MYITVDDIKNEVSLYYPIDNSNRDKKIGLICTYFIYSFYNVEKDERSTLRISNGNYIDMLLSKKMFSFKINKLSTTDNTLNGKPCDILYTGYINKDISFGDIVYFEPKNVQYKKLVIGTIGQLKVLLVDGDGNEIFSDFKISIVLHIV